MRFILAITACLATFPAHAWEAAEKVETYRIDGATGLELYRSIGRNGPQLGPTRAIAYTTFDLKWSRDYREEGGRKGSLTPARRLHAIPHGQECP